MESLTVIALAIILAAVAAGCLASSQAKGTAYDIDVGQAKELIDSNSAKGDFVVLDVRTPQEFAAGHISGALNLDFYSSSFKEKVGALDRGKTYLVYCRTGSRSAEAVKVMEGLGFAKLKNMAGGITEWDAKGYGTVS